MLQEEEDHREDYGAGPEENGMQMDDGERFQEHEEGMASAMPMEEQEDDEEEAPSSMAIVLNEDKKYYPSAEEVYGAETETLVQETDAQPIEVPIIAPVVQKSIEVSVEEGKFEAVPHAHPDFLSLLLSTPELVRNVAVAGHLHHGKTVLMDMLVEQTHRLQGATRPSPDAPLRYTDTRKDEQERGISLKAVPMSLVMENSSGKSYAMNVIDTPGHVNFGDEVSAGMRLADGLLLVVDAAEGVMLGTERALRAAAAEGLKVCLVITKIDRLLLELKLPPTDAYHKLRHTIREVNEVVAAVYGGDPSARLDPVKGNVAFAAPGYGWCFTLTSFAAMYAQKTSFPLDPVELAKRLWGDVWFHSEDRTFRKTPPASSGAERSFVQFCLNPLYKAHVATIGEDERSITQMADHLSVPISEETARSDVKPLLKTLLSGMFGSAAAALVDMLIHHVPSPKTATKTKVDRCYTGPRGTILAEHMEACNPRGPLVAYVAKLLPKTDASAFDALARIVSGTLKPGERVRVLGESFSPDDEEESAVSTVTAVWAAQGRYRVPLPQAAAGSWALLEGLDATISKTATIVPEFLDGNDNDEVYIFRPLRLGVHPIVKIAAEPLNPGELPKVVEGLRKLNRSYPALMTKVEESGEHTIFGTGELYLDSAMKDLREIYADVEVKVADPVASFCETVVETSALRCYAVTPNGRNKLTIVAEPLDRGLAEDIESGEISLTWPRKKVAGFLRENYDWDVLAARNVWAFGPDPQGPNVFLDDTLAGEVDKNLLSSIRSSVVQGFQWGSREGPLCDEPMRSVKFKLVDAAVASEPMYRGGGQLIPTARRACYSAFLTATPRIMEPVYRVEIQTPAECIQAIYAVLAKRRGHVSADVPKPGTPIFIVKAFLPVMESFGFETDVRLSTQGQAFCLSIFDHWQVVPGDPLDRTMILRPLEPAPIAGLARDFMVKTRRRKGLSDDVSAEKFFEDPEQRELAIEAGVML